MFKVFLILLLSVFLLLACSKKNNKEIVSEPTEKEMVVAIYAEAVDALKKGDAFYAAKNLKKLKGCCHKVNGPRKQVLWLAMQNIQETLFQIVFLV